MILIIYYNKIAQTTTPELCGQGLLTQALYYLHSLATNTSTTWLIGG